MWRNNCILQNIPLLLFMIYVPKVFLIFSLPVWFCSKKNEQRTILDKRLSRQKWYQYQEQLALVAFFWVFLLPIFASFARWNEDSCYFARVFFKVSVYGALSNPSCLCNTLLASNSSLLYSFIKHPWQCTAYKSLKVRGLLTHRFCHECRNQEQDTDRMCAKVWSSSCQAIMSVSWRNPRCPTKEGQELPLEGSSVSGWGKWW